ncbi:MAG TPA: helix-turn-helix domain-containing protein [Candidatus Acidoferrales bacterium]|nr:helix-turn-helix domain-containing protein [Candidatus Acidoferrales bacterium]
MTHEEIGELVGSSRETIARILSDFRRRGLIQIEGRSITIPDRSKLEALLF